MAKRGRPKHPDVLTPREGEVLELIRAGLSNPEIAQRLGISVEGVKYHVSEILGKLGVSTREEAARWTAEQHPWWAAAAAPVLRPGRAAVSFLRAQLSAAPAALAGGLMIAALAALGVLAFLLFHGAGTSSPGGLASSGPKLAFSAGGSIYTVNPDGSGLRAIIHGDRTAPNAAPALSPDGSHIAFVRDFEIWIARSDGSDAHRLTQVAQLATPPGASNPSLGVQTLAWAPNGKMIAYVLSRIGGSGKGEVWVIRDDGSETIKLFETVPGFVEATWLGSSSAQLVGDLAVYLPHGTTSFIKTFVIGDSGTLKVDYGTSDQELSSEQRSSLSAFFAPGNQWLVGPFTKEDAIKFGSSAALDQVAQGIGPVLSPDGASFAYFAGDSLRVASIDGSGDHQIVDLAPLGGRDRFFAEPCSSQELGICSYHPPAVSWSRGTPQPAINTVSPTSWRAFWQADTNTEWIGGAFCHPQNDATTCDGLIDKTTDGGATWQSQYRGDILVDQVEFVDAQTGWAAGPQGALCHETGGCPSALLRTTDGGAHWTQVYTTPRPVAQMSFVSTDGWLLGQEHGCVFTQPCTLYLARTKDAGKTWTESTLPVRGPGASLSRPTIGDAWISTGDETYVTHDGGASWQSLPEPFSGSPSIFFLSPERGWLLLGGEMANGTQAKELFGTADGGKTWMHLSGFHGAGRVSPTPDPVGGLDWGGYVGKILFTSPDKGWMALGRAGLFHSTDGGKTWAHIFYSDNLRDIRFADSLHGWTIDSVDLWVTSDGGVIWKPLRLPQLNPN